MGGGGKRVLLIAPIMCGSFNPLSAFLLQLSFYANANRKPAETYRESGKVRVNVMEFHILSTAFNLRQD